MDEFSDFASDDFDVKGWINATVAAHIKTLEGAGGAERNGVAREASSATLAVPSSGMDQRWESVYQLIVHTAV